MKKMNKKQYKILTKKEYIQIFMINQKVTNKKGMREQFQEL